MTRTARPPRAAAALLAAALLPLVALQASPAAAAPVTFSSTVAGTAVATNCMDVPGGASTAALQLVQNTCSGATSQKYTFTPVSGVANTYTVGTLTAGSCLDISGQSTADN